MFAIRISRVKSSIDRISIVVDDKNITLDAVGCRSKPQSSTSKIAPKTWLQMTGWSRLGAIDPSGILCVVKTQGFIWRDIALDHLFI